MPTIREGIKDVPGRVTKLGMRRAGPFLL